jgi:hypothetical protein
VSDKPLPRPPAQNSSEVVMTTARSPLSIEAPGLLRIVRKGTEEEAQRASGVLWDRIHSLDVAYAEKIMEVVDLKVALLRYEDAVGRLTDALDAARTT